jgi:uncharacterized repeat protein (TIGR01451 family)
MRTAATLGARLRRRTKADLLAVLTIAALAAIVATAAQAVGQGAKTWDKCPGRQVIQPVTTGTYTIKFGAETGSISLVVRATPKGPMVDFTTDGPTHLVDRVSVWHGDGANHFDYTPAGTTSGTVFAPVNKATGKHHVPSFLCLDTRLKPPPPPVDVCPNIPGDQAEIPPGMIKDEEGNCVTPPPPPVDVCPNIPGVQETIPPGMIKDGNGNCVTPPPPPPPPPPTDVCPNIPGVQETIPAGMVKDASGNCVTPPPPPTDVCPNIDGLQTEIPAGMVKDASGNCVTPPPPTVDLAIVKDDSADPVSVGRTVLYTITVTNNGPVKATGVVVTDSVPAGLEIVSVRANQGTCSTSGRTVTCRLGGLTPSSKAVVKVLTRGSAPGVVVNAARVTGDQPDSRPGNNSTSENTRIVAPFQPPPAVCDSVTVGRRTVKIGVRTTLRIVVKANGRGLAAERVRVRGAGIDVSARTNRLGVAVVSVRAQRPGVISINVAGERCARRIGAIGGGQPDLTG